VALTFVPLLRVQRDLYALPRGMERFRQYIRTMVDADTGAPGAFTVGLVVSDDLKGGWTNRYASEFTHRIEGAALTRRGWLTALLWTSEPASAAAVRGATDRATVMASVYGDPAAAALGYPPLADP